MLIHLTEIRNEIHTYVLSDADNIITLSSIDTLRKRPTWEDLSEPRRWLVNLTPWVVKIGYAALVREFAPLFQKHVEICIAQHEANVFFEAFPKTKEGEQDNADGDGFLKLRLSAWDEFWAKDLDTSFLHV
jgi:hypothetical protein